MFGKLAGILPNIGKLPQGRYFAAKTLPLARRPVGEPFGFP